MSGIIVSLFHGSIILGFSSNTFLGWMYGFLDFMPSSLLVFTEVHH